MDFEILKIFTDTLLFCCCLSILCGCLYLTVKMRFVQLRVFPELCRLLSRSFKERKGVDGTHTILPHKALFTAMSTTLGISTIVAPVIAIRLGGPGAMVGFLLTSLLGSAATYAEVNLSIRYRQVDEHGVHGGPMQYLKQIFSVKMAKWYAACCLVLMCAWSGAQANQLAAIFNSPLLGSYAIPTTVSGVFIAIFVVLILFGGIKRIGTFSAKLVPVMFVLYLGSCLWIMFANVDKWGTIFSQIFASAFAPYTMMNGMIVGGVVSALRWGVFKGLQTNEAGIGTQSIPHSMAETQDPTAQATLAMLSTYMAGFVAFLSGCVALITNTWQDPTLPLGISMVAASFQSYFSYFGIAIVVICTFLFGFGTILGNAFNGSQCFNYLAQNRWKNYYFLAMALMIFAGAIAEVTTIWSLVDLVLVLMAIPHMAGLVVFVYRKKTEIFSSNPTE